jgi:tRNA(Ile)-lysidine synthase
LIEKVKRTIQKHDMLDIDDTIIIGISGGPDSVALLFVLNTIKVEFNLTLIASHINYKLRGEESDMDEVFVENLCKKLDIPLHKKICSLTKSNGAISIQEEARNQRYDYFEELSRIYSANKIATGHNLDDSVETIFLNMLRGSGAKGLSGIPPKRGKIIRPLIECKRKKIIDYLENIDQEYRIDSSNSENKYLRNKIRNILLPDIRKYTPMELDKKIFQTGEILREEDDYLDGVTRDIFQKICDVISKEENISVHIPIEKLEKLHIAIKRRIIREGIMKVTGALDQFEKKHVDDILNLTQTIGKERKIHLPRDLEATKSYNNLILQRMNQPAKSSLIKNLHLTPSIIPLIIPGKTYFLKDSGFIKAELINLEDISDLHASSSEAYLDYSKCSSLSVRNRKDGDTFIPFGAKGSKKLKDYFIDKKVPKYKRNTIPIVVENSDIVWVVGYTIDNRYRVTEMAKTVLHLVYAP